MPRTSIILFLLVVAALASIFLSICIGSVTLSVNELQQALFGESESLAKTLVWQLRLPRAVTAFMVGGMLSLAGALMQVILKNPLADPYVLGVSGGASTAALLAMLLGITGISLTASAFAGALLSTALVFNIAKGKGSWSPMRVLLTGVVLAAGWGALISLILAISPNQNLRGMLFWLMGDLSHVQSVSSMSIVLLVGFLITFWQARPLNLLMHGSDQASALGVPVDQLHSLLFVIASLLTAVAVSMAGNIGFVGLIVPHLIRLSIGSDHRLLLPAAVLLGGTLLVIADLLARSILSPTQLPVGVITALLGVPLFLLILNRTQRVS